MMNDHLQFIGLFAMILNRSIIISYQKAIAAFAGRDSDSE